MKRVLAVLAAIVVVGLVVWSLVRQLGGRGGEETEEIAAPVVVSRPRRGEIARTLEYAGTLEPAAQVTLTPKVAGRVDLILVSEGQVVKAGETVAIIESDTVRLQSEQAASAYRAAKAQYEWALRGARGQERDNAQALVAQGEEDVTLAEENYARLERLFREGTIARTRLEDAERELRAARTGLENARRSVELLEEGASSEQLDAVEAQMQSMEAQASLANLALGNAVVTAPIAGRVALVHTDPGNIASLATPLVTLVQDDPMFVKVPVPEKHYADIRRAQTLILARVEPPALPELAFEGGIHTVSPTVDPSSRTFTVEIRIPNPEAQLRAGMYARVKLVLDRHKDALLLPAVAIQRRGERSGVFVLGDGSRVRMVDVVTGLEDGLNVEILLGPGIEERVVIEGGAFLEDGSLVRVVGSP